MKPKMAQVDLQRQLCTLKCEDGGDLCAHLDKLVEMQERLAGMGVKVDEDEFYTVVLVSLPESYSLLMNALTAAVSATGNMMKPSALSTLVKAEYDRHQARSTATNVENEALGTNTRGPTDSNKFKTPCENCKRLGHAKKNCWAKGGGKEGQGPRGRRGKRGGKRATTSGNTAATDSDSDDVAFITSVDGALLAGMKGTRAIKVTKVWDTGASTHMSPYRELFINFTPINPPKSIRAADKTTFEAIGKGDMRIEVPNGRGNSHILLKDVLYTPNIAFTLISIGHCDSAGLHCTFGGNRCLLCNQSGQILAAIPKIHGLYRFEHDSLMKPSACVAHTAISLSELHNRMGHISPVIAGRLVKENVIEGIKVDPSIPTRPCNACTKAKITRKPVPKQRASNLATHQGDKVHTDVWGPAQVATIGGKCYYISFTDDCTRETTIYLVCKKSEAFEKYKQYEASLLTQRNVKIKRLQSDRGGEYLSDEFKQHLAFHGTSHQLTVHDTPEENGVAECLNRTLVEHVRAMLLAAGPPKYLWGEAIMHATYLKNHTSTRALPMKTPFEIVHGVKPNLSNLPCWGSQVYVKMENVPKLNAKAQSRHWVGFSADSIGHRIYWASKRTVTVERNVIFATDPAALPEGETRLISGLDTSKRIKSPIPAVEPSSIPLPPSPSPSTPDPLDDFEKTPEPIKGHGARVKKPSQYVHQILEGGGVTDTRPQAPTFPKGVQVPTEKPSAALAFESEEEDELPALEQDMSLLMNDRIEGESEMFALPSRPSLGAPETLAEETRRLARVGGVNEKGNRWTAYQRHMGSG